jgi:hypothetical protein
MPMKRYAALALLPLAVSGCAATGGVGLGIAQGALTGALAGAAPPITVEQILEQYALYHNLKVQMETIDASGIVTTTTQTPVVITGTPMTPPAPVTPTPPVVVTPPVVIPPSTTGGPVVTPNTHRYRRSVRDLENLGELVAD